MEMLVPRGAPLRCLSSALKVVMCFQAPGMALLFRLGVWVVLGALLLPEAGSHHPPPGYAVHEIIRPRTLVTVAGKSALGEVSYIIRVEGKDRIVRLMQTQGLVVSNLPLITYSPSGRRVVEQPHVPEGCYHLGYVEGSPGSMAALNTCAGLRGQLKIGNLSYGIQPVPGSLTFQHLLYRREKNWNRFSTCGLTDIVMRKQPNWRGAKKPLGKKRLDQRLQHTRYVEIYIVVDQQLFSFQERNETTVMFLVIDTINLAEIHYYSLKVRICLIGLEIWTRGNLIRDSPDIEEVLNNFNDWGNKHLSPRIKYDIAHLFTYTDFGLTVGLAYIGSICHPGYRSALVSYIREDLATFAIIFTHVLGHNLGMEHDRRECSCGNAKCYMTGGSVDGATAFSNCSIQSYLDLLSSGDGNCLNNIPEPNKFFTFKTCGNKVIDEGEQCDCGGIHDCRGNPCCYHDCKLKPGAVCSVGQCCQKCRFQPPGYMCRSEAEECDLPEYCNGTSEWCPSDLYLQDGTPCSDDGYCYRGRCASLDKQCRKVFGAEARVAPEGCFKQQNMKGDRFGNCGGDGNEVAFVECRPQNALCGRLQCVNVKKTAFLEKSETLIQAPGPEGWCWGTVHKASIDTPDIGGGTDGTKCGPKHICINKICTNSTILAKCDANVLCNENGVCNNLGQCHCYPGWAPPGCEYHGLGGSLDSGPPPALMISNAEAVHDKTFGIAIGITVPVAFVLGALLFVVIKYINTITAFFRKTSPIETSETPENEEQKSEEEEEGEKEEEEEEDKV
ncbi:disintegrin and metalloproteinase domain-containing protein 9-like [Coturnix japonica]|uniref:Disintegrin and metalloproteinase domain-containing protein 9-like n=1 Tax=Coturnix japonica TaxID=93934 RepID=A0A8C2T2X5_COTJA|nr:disintegrin and metalloproteinase domain-containing protein 9-like [Coturnix japonica]